MMRLSRRRTVGRAAVAAALCLSVALSAGSAAARQGAVSGSGASTVVRTATGTDITFTGHGWGHGRGMGQYGALGYAVDDGWGYFQILEHFYNNTSTGLVGNATISVELVSVFNTQLRATGTGITINGTPVPTGVTGVVAATTADDRVQIRAASGCGATGAVIGTYASGVAISTTNQSTLDGLIRLCEADGGERAYRGSLQVRLHPTTRQQVNMSVLPLEQYLRGVVPRESPASWGNLGSGRGMEALKAQTVAARSYVMAAKVARASGATTCDTTSCQVYGGAARKVSASAPLESLEQPNTDAAIAATAGEVRLMGNGDIARTEFSSSTGGYTAGGTFPAVPDAGDDIASNPNRTWTTTTTASALASRLGIPGPIRDIQVTARNRLGDWGGRATQLRVVDANGGVHVYNSGETIRSRLGLKSDWFTISFVSSVAAQNVVKALYRDVLGRAVDPSGLQTWTDYILRTGDTAGLVRQIATSRERMNNLVAAQYQLALRRGPEPAGLEHWVRYLEAGWGVYDLQVAIYGSPESLLRLGGNNVDTWVGALYESLLGRPSAASERTYWVGVASRQGREAVVASIARSDEATMRRLTVYYQTFLLRGVDPSGRATFLPMMTGRGDFDVPVHLGSSPEYWQRAQTRSF